MQVFVVIDTKGAGRLVGVFRSRLRAVRLQDINPGYYRVQPLTLDEIRPDVVDWLQTDDQKAQLEVMMRDEPAPRRRRG
jgi:hypothetical protein